MPRGEPEKPFITLIQIKERLTDSCESDRMIDHVTSPLPVTRAIELATAAGHWSTELDARAGSPPDHFRAILDALNSLLPGYPQFFRTQSRPVDLLRKFAAQGVFTATEELPDGSWRSVLDRSVPASHFQ